MEPYYPINKLDEDVFAFVCVSVAYVINNLQS